MPERTSACRNTRLPWPYSAHRVRPQERRPSGNVAGNQAFVSMAFISIERVEHFLPSGHARRIAVPSEKPHSPTDVDDGRGSRNNRGSACSIEVTPWGLSPSGDSGKGVRCEGSLALC